MRHARPAAAVALALLLAGCGYRAVTPYRGRGGAERIHVRPFENDSADPELGAAVTAALRDELDRRGAWGGEDAPAQLEGAVRVASATGSAVAIEIHARLSVEGKVVQQVTVPLTAGHQAGVDPLETEGRQATAIRKAARDAARQVLRALEAPATPPPASASK